MDDAVDFLGLTINQRLYECSEWLPESDEIQARPVGSELAVELNFGTRRFLPHVEPSEAAVQLN